jgi:hypothetical protein
MMIQSEERLELLLAVQQPGVRWFWMPMDEIWRLLRTGMLSARASVLRMKQCI